MWWASLFATVAFLALAMHPFVTYPATLMLVRRRQGVVGSGAGTRPSLAILMSVYNEEKVIEAKAANLLSMAEQYGPATVHIYVDGAQDGTAGLLRAFQDRIRITVSPDRRGKTYGMKLLAAQSHSDLMAFTDANVVCDADAAIRLAKALDDPQIACASPRLVYSNADESGATATGAAYWNLEEWIKQLESATIGVIGVDGALFLMKRSAYHPPSDDLIDDLAVSLAITSQGLRVVSVPDVIVRERSSTSNREEFTRKARIACQAIHVHRAMWPSIKRFEPPQLYGYFSHRVLKWAMPFNLAMAGLCLLGSIIALLGPGWALGALIVVGALLTLGCRLRNSAAEASAAALISLAGVATGVIESLFFRRTYVVWTPAASVRQA